MAAERRIGRYRVERLLGRGGYATVWLARDEELDATVALKVLAENWSLDEEVSRRFVEEARILRRLDHDRVIRVYTIDRLEDGRPFFVMEYADGGTLQQRMDQRRSAGSRISIEEAASTAIEIGQCLRVIHSLGVVHRDLKPSNILFRTAGRMVGSENDKGPSPSERMQLADFGIARRMDKVSGSTITAGTPLYMAPEQADPETAGAVDARSDLYAAAVILFEQLTGEVPYAATPVRSAPADGAPSARDRRADVPAWLDRAISRGLSADVTTRWQNADDWIKAIAGPPARDADAPTSGTVLSGAGALLDLCDEMLSEATTPELQAALESARAGLAGPLRLALATEVDVPANRVTVDGLARYLEVRVGAELVLPDQMSESDGPVDGVCLVFEPERTAEALERIAEFEARGVIGTLQVIAIALARRRQANIPESDEVIGGGAFAGKVAQSIRVGPEWDADQVDRLIQVLQVEIVARSGLMRTRRTLEALDRASEEAAHGKDGVVAENLRDRLEGIALGAHELKELSALEDARTGRAILPKDLLHDIERIYGAGPVRARLGLAADATHAELIERILTGARLWRSFLNDGRANYGSRRLGEVVAGSYDRLLIGVSEGRDV